jgi:hypothetical protein
MSRRLASYLAAGALLVSVAVGSIGAHQTLAMVIGQVGDPPPPEPVPAGLTSAEPSRLPPDVIAGGKADFIPAATSDEAIAGSSRKAAQTEVSV